MSIPEQVRRQAERATELQAQAYGNPGQPDPVAVPGSPAPEDPPVEPAPAPTPAAPAEPAPPAPPAPPVEDWEQKYRTLQGVLRAESGKWQAEKATLEGRITALQAAPPAQAAPAPAPQARDANDVETYGPEMLDVIERRATAIAQNIVAEQMAKLAPQLEQTQAQVTSVAQKVYKTDEEKFYGELKREVSDWETIDRDPRWLEWLDQVDPLSGMKRQAYIDNASQNMDHARAANLFKAFKTEAGLNPAPAPAPSAAAPAAPALSPSPRTVGTATAPRIQEPGPASVKRSELTAHYRRGSTDPAYRSSAEHAAFEVRIGAAMAAGAIVEG